MSRISYSNYETKYTLLRLSIILEVNKKGDPQHYRVLLLVFDNFMKIYF